MNNPHIKILLVAIIICLTPSFFFDGFTFHVSANRDDQSDQQRDPRDPCRNHPSLLSRVVLAGTALPVTVSTPRLT